MASLPTLAPLAPPPPPRAAFRSHLSLARLGLGALFLAVLGVACVVVILFARSPGAGHTPIMPPPRADLSGVLKPSWPDGAAHVPPSCSPHSKYSVARALTIGADEWICGRATAVGASVTVLGRVGGDVFVMGGSATIAGQVDGGVTAVGGNVSLLRGARIGGSVAAYGGTVHREAAVLVGGGIKHDSMLAQLSPLRQPFFVPGYGPPWPSLIFWGLAGVVVAKFFRDPLRRVESVASQQFGASVLTGVVAALGTIILAILLAVTCLGIPVAAALLLTVWVSWVVGTVAVGYRLGQLLLGAALPRDRQLVLIPAVGGVLMLAAAEAIPYVGVVIGVVVGCAALGSVLLTFIRARHQRHLAS